MIVKNIIFKMYVRVLVKVFLEMIMGDVSVINE